jgi:bifunctional DNA-binding transcriptional regulator/antitoxin component of YhaV-PrlF toxin-antitoxin module
VQKATVRVSQRGLIALSKVLRETYDICPGDSLLLFDLGGVFVLSPHRSKVDAIADKLRTEWQVSGETLEGMLQALREEREKTEE